MLRLHLSEHKRIDAAIEALDPRDLSSLRLMRFSKFTYETLAPHVAEHPGLALRVYGQNEYAVGGYWRRRPEIGSIEEMTQGRYRKPLLLRLVEEFRRRGTKLVVVYSADLALFHSFYSNMGFHKLDEIIELERPGCRDVPDTRHARMSRAGLGDLSTLLATDRASFPWLWWNSQKELEWYLRQDSVEVYQTWCGVDAVGYAGFSQHGPVGYIDRLAVRPEWQGRGFGAALLAFVLATMGTRGVSHVGLSTQSSNLRAQALYRHFGFRRSHRSQRVYGLWLQESLVES
ncbi:MAG: GNAT family N-acetyltransferase [Chloroflexi bacterium]|nr:GNAT family N-acetyltransferase [Chloroflexota bacterium]